MLFGKQPGEYVLNSLAKKLQEPRWRSKFIIAYGKYGGEGKNAMEAILSGVFGKAHCLSTPGTKHILGQGEAGFNALAEEALLCFIQEAKAEDKSIVCEEKFKNWLTEPIQQIRRMRMDPYNAANYAMAFLWTNNRSAVKMSPAMARRTMAVEVSDEKIDDKAYFDKLWGLVESQEAIEEIFNWLAHYDVSKFNPEDMPRTKLMEQMKEEGLSELQRYIVEVCNGEREQLEVEGTSICIPKKVFFDDYRARCEEEGIQKKFVMIAKNFKIELESLGFEEKQIRFDESRPWCFIAEIDEIEKTMRKILKNDEWKLRRGN
jgi:hypothetical protein